MQTTGLLTSEQLDTVFVNLDDLITINSQLTEKLRAAFHKAAKDCDQVSTAAVAFYWCCFWS